MKRRTIVVVSALLLLGLFFISYLARPRVRVPQELGTRSAVLGAPNSASAISPVASTNTVLNSSEADQRAVVEKVIESLSMPIVFYGKVIDQFEAPVVGAQVNYTVLDKFAESGSDYQGKSDANGNFSISDIKGGALSVGVRKQGYYRIDGKSSGDFAYGIGLDPTLREAPTKDKPAIFVLQRRGAGGPMYHVESIQIDIPAGAPLKLDLATGRTGRGDLLVTSSLGAVESNQFDWHYDLDISGGGLIEREGEFDFEAPSDGYKEHVEVGSNANDERWLPSISKDYFARLKDGRYARFSIRFYPGDRNFIVVESFVNPNVGDRNLEFNGTRFK